MPESTRKRYRGQAVDVSYDPVRCRHAAECIRGLRAVFDPGRRPWIQPDSADPEDVVRVVARCPTGALRTHPKATAASEDAVVPTEVTAVPDGPLLLRGALHVRGPAGVDERETRAALCSCGSTANSPYCDGGGTCAGWPHARGAEAS